MSSERSWYPGGKAIEVEVGHRKRCTLDEIVAYGPWVAVGAENPATVATQLFEKRNLYALFRSDTSSMMIQISSPFFDS